VFTFLFVYATLLSLTPQCVDVAGVEGIDRSIDSYPGDDFALTSTLAMMTRFIWDPGGMSSIEPGVNPLCHRVRRVWDPGINSSSLLDTSILLTVTSIVTVFMATMARRLPLDLMSRWMPIPSTRNNNDVTIATRVPSSAPAQATAPYFALRCDRDPFLLRPTRPMVSMFHYSHPVLSRPTVPNI